MTLPTLADGALFGTHWIAGRVIGKHDLAVVYEAEDTRRARFAALKIFEPSLGRDRVAWMRFEALTRTLAELPGDGIARAFDVGLVDDYPFVVSERSAFPTLARCVAEHGPFAPRAFRDTLLTLAGALETVHRAGFVHGNLKPQNAFVSPDHPGWARLTDFGVAELRVAAGVNQARTLGWNAPEVSPSPPTSASDLFTLGLLAFFAISGSPWYSVQRTSTASGGERPNTASERARAYGGEIPAALDAWFERALARAPADRFPSALEMAQAFAFVLDGPRAPSRPPIGALAPTVPVPEYTSSPPNAFPGPSGPPSIAANGPAAPLPAATEPLPARPAMAQAITVIAEDSFLPPSVPSRAPKSGTSASNTVVLLAGALVIGLLALGLVLWFFWTHP